jgi:predicted phosphodiesterase
MKIIYIGDTHGRDCWMKIVEQNPDADLFVFAGDYFDSLTIPALSQINNFKLILNFRNENPDKVILLFGNHDFHYTSGCIGGTYTGFDYSVFYNMKLELESLIRQEILKICYVKDDILFSHAGVTKTWCENNNVDLENLEDSLNQILLYKPHLFAFKSGIRRDKFGDDITQGPLWVREKSLKEDGLSDYVHIVGHSSSDEIIFNLSDDGAKYIIADTLRNEKYLEIIIEEGKSKQFNSKTIY